MFESTNTPDVQDGGNGIICFITATGYLAGPGFKGMRKYLRQTCSHGWIINVTPEGKQPPSRNAVFNIETPVAIALFARSEGTGDNDPAVINYIDIHGTREEKFAQLAVLELDGPDWRPVRTEWTAPFTPAATTDWDDYPALDDLFPWKANGIMAGRGWIYAPTPDVLEHRLRDVINEDDADEKAKKFINSRDASLTKTKAPLPGTDTEQGTRSPFGEITMLTDPHIVGCGYRVLDRQYVIADSRLMSQPSPTLWSGRVPGQVFAYELHSEYPRTGPAVAYTTLIPDVHFFRGSGGGRALPKLHPDGSTNTATGLPEALAKILGGKVDAGDIFDYVAGVAGHSGFVGQFDDELHTPGVRVPITADRHLFDRAVILGRHYQWLHTYGEAGAHPDGYTDVRDHRIPITHPEYTVPVGNSCPLEWSYEDTTKTLNVGPGRWTHVEPEALDYTVGGANVLRSWLNYRLARPRRVYRSPLDEINATRWDGSWSAELSNLLSILGQLVALEEEMSELLTDILAGALVSRADLTAAGVVWPSSAADRRPRASAEGTIFAPDTSPS